MMIWITELVWPWLQMALYGALFMAVVIPGGYYFLVVRRRRRCEATIWERRGDDDAIIVARDLVVEQKIKGKSAFTYKLRNANFMVAPIDERYVKSFRGKNYINYLRVGSDYIPFIQAFDFSKNSRTFTPMPYDVMMQMLNLEDEINSIWADKIGWLEKYKEIIAIAIIGIVMIVLMSQYFDFVANSIEPVKESVGALKSIADTIVGR